MAQTPERSIPEKVFRAHTLAGKAHKDGAKPLTRLGGALAVGAIGVGTEILVEKGTPFLQEKYSWLKLDKLQPPLRELLEDGVVGVIYTVANKNLGEALPKLKLRHLTTSAVGTLAVLGGEKVVGKVGEKVSKWRESRKKVTPNAPAVTPVSPEQPVIPVQTTEKKKSILDYINPVTALAADEARMAFTDWLDAYKAVSTGTEEEFVSTHTPKDGKEPTVTKETTIIFLGNDQQLASALETVAAS